MRVLVARGRINLLLVRGRGKRLLLHTSFRTRARIGHMRQDYPQRQGSQDFGIAQSVRGTSFSFGVLYKHSSSTDMPEGLDCGSKSGTDQSCAAEVWWTLAGFAYPTRPWIWA